jgi:hypothetical protein
MKRSNSRCALSLAALVALLAIPTVSARADDDDHHWHHDRGHHRGWYKHHDEDGPQVYYAPSPVYVAPAAPVYIAPPPPVVYAPAPVYAPPSLNVIVPLRFK